MRDSDTIISIRLIAGLVLLAGQFICQLFGITPSWLLVAAALSLIFGVPLIYGMESRRRDNTSDRDND